MSNKRREIGRLALQSTACGQQLVAVHEAGHLVVARAFGYGRSSGAIWRGLESWCGWVGIGGEFACAYHGRLFGVSGGVAVCLHLEVDLAQAT